MSQKLWTLWQVVYEYYVTYRIVESKNPKFKEGDHVIATFGWRTYTISNGENVYKLDPKIYTAQKLSTALGVLGMPGYVRPAEFECCYVYAIQCMLY